MMHEVEELFEGQRCRTAFWLTAKVRQEIVDYVRKNKQSGQRLLVKLEYYARNGFEIFESRNGPIRHEWDSVYRIGHPKDLFRIIGFYEGRRREIFVAIDAYHKRGTKLSASERRRIDNVAKIRRDGLWRKKVRHGDYPRLADNS